MSHEPMTLISCKNYPLASKSCCEPKVLKGEDLIQIEEHDCIYRIIFEAQLAEVGVQPGSVFEFGSVESTKNVGERLRNFIATSDRSRTRNYIWAIKGHTLDWSGL